MRRWVGLLRRVPGIKYNSELGHKNSSSIDHMTTVADLIVRMIKLISFSILLWSIYGGHVAGGVDGMSVGGVTSKMC